MNKTRYKRILTKAMNIVYWCIVTIICAAMIYVIGLVTVFDTFHVPGSSMMPTIRPDDHGVINKLKLGGRLFDIRAAAEGRPFEVHRLPGYGQLERGDVIVFNYPLADAERTSGSAGMNMRVYYCKRAVAVAGDTLEIRGSFYRVNGQSDTIGVAAEQMKLQRYVAEYAKENPDTSTWRSWMKCYPADSTRNWTVVEMGPLLIPAKGSVIRLTHSDWLYYRRHIEWETGRKLEWVDGHAVMDGKVIDEYTFNENYCFAAGDHVIDSKDSRYFGLVPEKFIVGTADFIWKSHDKSRIFKFLNKH